MADPVIGNIAPAAGTAITKSQSITLEVTDADANLGKVIITMNQDTDPRPPEVLIQSPIFTSAYKGTINTVITITNGFRYTFLRDGGWRGPITLRVQAFDQTGGVIDTTLKWSLGGL